MSEKSLMPEGLGYNMTPQDFRDLVRYVMANPFITDVTVNGEKTRRSACRAGYVTRHEGRTRGGRGRGDRAGDVKTKLLVGSSADYEVQARRQADRRREGDRQAASARSGQLRCDAAGGKHTLAIVVKGGAGNVLYARFLDPDRKLSYPDAGEKK